MTAAAKVRVAKMGNAIALCVADANSMTPSYGMMR